MKVLVAFEYSGVVRDAFITKGHDAKSCDLLPTERPGPHYKGDIIDMLKQDYDLIIAHPPCTALCVAGNSTYGLGKDKYKERMDSAKWTQCLWYQCKKWSPRVCFENPVGVLTSMTDLPKPQYIQPYQFGHKEQKKTGLFLHGLGPLIETNNVYEEMMKLPKKERERIHYMSPGPERGKARSLTFQGIADAMADQWGGL